jgi:hypothetical protein
MGAACKSQTRAVQSALPVTAKRPRLVSTTDSASPPAAAAAAAVRSRAGPTGPPAERRKRAQSRRAPAARPAAGVQLRPREGRWQPRQPPGLLPARPPAPAPRTVPLESLDALSGGHVPHQAHAVTRHSHNGLGVARDRHVVQPRAVAVQHGDAAAAGQVPDAACGRAGSGTARGGRRHAAGQRPAAALRALMHPAQRTQTRQPSTRQAPGASRRRRAPRTGVVVRRGHGAAALQVDRHPVDAPLVALQHRQALALVGVPHARGAVVRARDQPVAAPQERDADHPAAVALRGGEGAGRRRQAPGGGVERRAGSLPQALTSASALRRTARVRRAVGAVPRNPSPAAQQPSGPAAQRPRHPQPRGRPAAHLQRVQQLLLLQVPHAHRKVVVGGRHQHAVSRHGHVAHALPGGALLVAQRLQAAQPRGAVPDLDRPAWGQKGRGAGQGRGAGEARGSRAIAAGSRCAAGGGGGAASSPAQPTAGRRRTRPRPPSPRVRPASPWRAS